MNLEHWELDYWEPDARQRTTLYFENAEEAMTEWDRINRDEWNTVGELRHIEVIRERPKK